MLLFLLPAAFAAPFVADPWWSAGPPAGAGNFGLGLAIGDFTGDGVADFAVGGPLSGDGDDWSGEYPGAVYLYEGVAGSTPDATPTGEWQPGERALAGSPLTALGDVDGDGIDDLAWAGTHGDDFDGVVYVAYGGAPWGDGVQEITSPWPDAQLASALAGAGDVDGDGYRDLFAGAYVAADGDGAAALFAGGAVGVAGAPAWTLAGSVPGGLLGDSVSALGDVDGDGFDDVCVASIDAVVDGDWGGAASLYAGAAGWPGGPTQVFTGDTTVHSQLGCPAAGDFDADGATDLAFPEPAWYRDSTRLGRIRLAEWDGGAFVDGAWVEGPFVKRTQTMFARTIDVADLDGDGFADLVTTAYRGDDGVPSEGLVYAWAGSAAGLDPTSPYTWSADEDSAFVGLVLAHPADADGDGNADLLVTSGVTTTLPAGGVLVLRAEPAAPPDSGDTGDTSADTGDTSADTGDTSADTGDTSADTGDTSADSGDTGDTSADAGDTGDTSPDTGDTSDTSTDGGCSGCAQHAGGSAAPWWSAGLAALVLARGRRRER